jgi:hypothetical protein
MLFPRMSTVTLSFNRSWSVVSTAAISAWHVLILAAFPFDCFFDHVFSFRNKSSKENYIDEYKYIRECLFQLIDEKYGRE